ncbi:MAG: VOC family protein [Pseudomonadota bacterium]
MHAPAAASGGTFCWLDLAARDDDAAMAFYSQVFGWRFATRHANGGRFTHCRVGGRDVASLYRLSEAHRKQGMPSHWTPYLRVDDVDALAPRIGPLGGRVLVAPFEVERSARIALIEDSVGAVVGLWQPLSQVGLGTMRA